MFWNGAGILKIGLCIDQDLVQEPSSLTLVEDVPLRNIIQESSS